MLYRAIVALTIPIPCLTGESRRGPPNAAGEYSEHFRALSEMSVAVAKAMALSSMYSALA